MTDQATYWVGDDYAYPNFNSYASMGRAASNRRLAHGYIYALDQSGTSNATFVKRFQFNPPTVGMALSMVATDPASTEQAGGALNPGAFGVGAMSSSVELMFNREIEVYYHGPSTGRSINNSDSAGVSSFRSDQLAVFRKIGVMKDIYDLMRVFLKGTGDEGSELTLPPVVDNTPSLSSVARKVYDLSISGRQINSRPIGLVYGDGSTAAAMAASGSNMALFGFISSFNLVFNKFSLDLVPTMCQVTLGLDVLQQRASDLIDKTATSTTGVTPTTTPSTATPADYYVTLPTAADNINSAFVTDHWVTVTNPNGYRWDPTSGYIYDRFGRQSGRLRAPNVTIGETLVPSGPDQGLVANKDGVVVV